MIAITKCNVPSYLHRSDLYRSLCRGTDDDDEDDDNEAAMIPNACMKMSTEIETFYDARHLLETMKYWGCDDVPASLCNFFLTVKHQQRSQEEQIFTLLEEYCYVLQNLQLLMDVLRKSEYAEQFLISAQVGLVSLMEIIQHHYQASLESLSSLERRQTREDFGKKTNSVCAIAAGSNQLNSLKFALKSGYAWDERCCAWALLQGHQQCLLYCIENGCPMPGQFSGTSRRQRDPLPRYFTRGIARAGFLDCLKAAHQRGATLNPGTCTAAAGRGHLECLKYAHVNGVRFDGNTFSEAARNNHVSCLAYVHKHGAEWKESVYSIMTRNKAWDCLRYCIEENCNVPVKAGFTSDIASEGNLEMLQLLVCTGHKLHPSTLPAAAREGHLECLKFAHRSLGEDTSNHQQQACKTAAAGGHLNCLEYAFENGFMRNDDEVYCAAAVNHHLDCFIYAHVQGAAIGEETLLAIARADEVECLNYILSVCAERRGDIPVMNFERAGLAKAKAAAELGNSLRVLPYFQQQLKIDKESS